MMNKRPLPAILLSIAALGACSPTHAGPSPVATMTAAAGDVVVVRAADADELEGMEDLDLFEGDTVRTGPGGAATIAFLDRHIVRLGRKSTLVLKSVRPAGSGIVARLRLAAGSLYASVARFATTSASFRVETSTAVAAVKGTTFSVEEGEEGSTVSVLEGTVSTAGLDEEGRETDAVDVPEGQETSVARRGRRPGKPRGFMRNARRAGMRRGLEGMRRDADEHRKMSESGELGRVRRMRNMVRVERLLDLKKNDPEAFAALPEGRRKAIEEYIARHQRDIEANRGEMEKFLKKHPGMRDRLRGEADRRTRVRGRGKDKDRDGNRGGGRERPARREKPARGRR